MENRSLPSGMPVLLKDIQAGSSGSTPGNFVEVGETTFFTAFDATGGNELWKTGDRRANRTHFGAEIGPTWLVI